MTATFEQWIQASFDHSPPKTDDDDWFWDEGFDSFWESLGITDAVAVKYLTRTDETGHIMLVDQAPERASGWTALPFLGRPAKHDLALPASTEVEFVPRLRHALEKFRVKDHGE